MQRTLKKEGSIVIYIDTREMNTKVSGILKKMCDVREKQLDSADYLLSEHIGAERKTSSDFLQSLTDGRLFEQLGRMKECFETSVLVIEGNSLFEQGRKIHPNAIRGALASIAIDMAIPIIWTQSQLETAEMLFTIAKREQLEMKKGISIRGKRKFRSMNQQQEFLVAGIEKISTAKARALLKHFGTPERIFTASEEELKKVEGIGPEIAKKIRKALATKYEKSILEND